MSLKVTRPVRPGIADDATWWIQPAESNSSGHPLGRWIAATVDEGEAVEFMSSREAREYIDARIDRSGHEHGTPRARWWPGQVVSGSAEQLAARTFEEREQYRRRYYQREQIPLMLIHPDEVDRLAFGDGRRLEPLREVERQLAAARRLQHGAEVDRFEKVRVAIIHNLDGWNQDRIQSDAARAVIEGERDAALKLLEDAMKASGHAGDCAYRLRLRQHGGYGDQEEEDAIVAAEPELCDCWYGAAVLATAG